MSKTFRLSFSGNNVQMSVSGIQGTGCTQVSSALTKNLGADVKDQRYTDEFYLEPAPEVTNDTTQTNLG